MQIGQHRAPPIPFWCNFLLICCVLAFTACSDRSERGAENAALAQQALAANDVRAAREAIAAAIDDRDDVVEYHLLRGRIELAAGSQGAAFNAYNDALSLDATNGEALLNVAQLGLSTGHLRDSLDATEHVLSLAPDNIDALLIRGIHSIIRREYPEAIEYGDKILALSPGHEGGTVLKSRALYMSRQPSEALAVLDGISGAAANSIAAAMTRLEIYRALRQQDDLGREFLLLRRLRPDDLALRTDEANFRFKIGDRRQAHELVAGVLANGEVDRAIAELAIGLWQEYGFNDVPRALFERIGRSGSDASRQALVRFLIRHDRAAQANATLATLPGNAATGLRARSLVLAGKLAEALALAQTVIERDATDCDALIAASEASAGRRAAADALRFAQLAAAECPGQSGAWLASARAYRALGRTSGVDRVYAEALDANKQSSELTAAYAQWLVSEGRSREAIAMARRLTRFAPALSSGWRLYGDLCRRFDARCTAEAEEGLATARTLFGVDPPPGAAAPNGLFGRLAER
jgi:tetratricopeptide (TPR) repeat protein